MGFVLLGLALENATGIDFPELLQSRVLQPLGMHHTTFVKPKDSAGIIPHGRNHWSWDLGTANP